MIFCIQDYTCAIKRGAMLVVAAIVAICFFKGECRGGGLVFPGNERRFSERSALRLFTDGNKPGPVDSLSIEFKYTPHNIKSPGYIFFLKNDDGAEAFNLIYSFANGNGTVSFAQDGKQMLLSKGFPADEFPNRLNIGLKLYVAADSAVVTIGSQTKKLTNIGLNSKTFSPRFFFGMCDHIIETASFSISALKINIDDREYDFPLDESSGTEVHTADGQVMGEVSNPIWLINRSYYWDHIFSASFSTPAGCIFADTLNEFLIYSRDSLLTFDLRERDISKEPYTADEGWFTRLGMGFYDPLHNNIYAYELHYDHTIVGEIGIEERHCRLLDKGNANLQLHHHCGVYLAGQNKILLFGGYGRRKYYNEFIEYDITNSRWNTLQFTGDTIPPRFFAAMGVSADEKTIYIYGGKGNPSGNQDVGVTYYYDLYKIDLQKKTIRKLWEQPAPEIKRVPTRRLIIDPEEDFFYVLAYPEYHPHSQLQLLRISMADGSTQELADSIPIESEEIATNAALYYNPSLDKFYCVVQEYAVVKEPAEGSENTVNIYSLEAPPVSLAAVKRYETKESATSKWLLPVIILIFLLATGTILLLYTRHRRQTKVAIHPEDPMETETDEEEEMDPDNRLYILAPPRRNSLYLFGPFTAMDRKGRDISYMFSPKIRQIFIYVLLSSIQKEGVMSSDISSIFWADKPEEKIKNLKNVTISKLRKVLQEFEGVELIYRKGYFKVEMTEEFYCDYVILSNLSGNFSERQGRAPLSTEILDILARGKFLTGLDQQIFDYYRLQVEQFTIAVLADHIEQTYLRGENSATLLACNILSMADPLSETALRYTLKTHLRRQHKEKAMTAYRLFVKEYKKTMGENYPLSFSELTE